MLLQPLHRKADHDTGEGSNSLVCTRAIGAVRRGGQGKFV